MIKFKISRFSLKLIMSFLSVILFFVAFTTIYYYKSATSSLQHELISSNTYTLQQIASNINSNLHDFDATSSLLLVSSKIQAISTDDSSSPENLSAKASDFNQFSEDKEIQDMLYTALFTSDNIKNIFIYSKTENIFGSNLANEAYLAINYQTLLAQCTKANSDFISGKLFWIYNKETSSLSSFRLLRSLIKMKPIGIMELRPKTIFIQNIINNSGLAQSYNILLFDEHKNIIFKKDNSLGSDYSQLLQHSYGTKIEGNFETTINKKDFNVLYRKINSVGWTLVMSISDEEINNNILKSSQFIVKVGIIISLVCILVAIILSYEISSPVRKLRKVMKIVESGNLDVQIADLGKDEIGDLGRSFNNMVKQLRKLIDEMYVQKLINKDSELAALQAQINPHFLYNTLESINCIAELKGVKEISKMVKILAQLLRNSISDNKEYITIEKELENIKSYIYLQNVRFGDKIKMDIKCIETIKVAKIPKLILQPVVENSIIHGLEQKIGNGHLTIDISQPGDIIIISIEDDGVGFDKNKIEFRNTGFGMKNVDRRIKILFGEEYGLSIDSNPGKGTCVIIVLPLILS